MYFTNFNIIVLSPNNVLLSYYTRVEMVESTLRIYFFQTEEVCSHFGSTNRQPTLKYF